MKKIFLTSGLVMCMACPAFATVDLDTSGNATGYENECVEPVLGVYEAPANDPVQLEAKWTANKSGAITLVSSIYPSNNHSSTALYTGANSDGLTTATPTPVYSVYDTGIYSDSAAQTLITELATDPSKDGYTFNGFYTADGNTQVIDNTGAFTAAAKTQIQSIGGTATWYAHWTADQYNVTYAPGVHSASSSYIDPTKAVYDGTYNVLAQNTTGITANAGYTFTGWRDETHSIDYTAGTSTISPWKYTDGITLTAQYSANPYQITYAGGTAGSRPVTATAMSATNVHYDDTNVALAANTYAIDGYHFTGWLGDHALDGSSTTNPKTAYTDEQVISQYKVVGDLALTAQWAANTTTVSYSCVMDNTANAYSGTAPTTNTSATYDATFAFAANTNCARDGWTFDGWTCKAGNTTLTQADVFGANAANGTSTVIPAGGTALTWLYTGADQGSISCVAHYSANTIHVNWYKNDGSEETTPYNANSCIYDGDLEVPTNPTRNGYQFSGWTVRSTSQN